MLHVHTVVQSGGESRPVPLIAHGQLESFVSFKPKAPISAKHRIGAILTDGYWRRIKPLFPRMWPSPECTEPTNQPSDSTPNHDTANEKSSRERNAEDGEPNQGRFVTFFPPRGSPAQFSCSFPRPSCTLFGAQCQGKFLTVSNFRRVVLWCPLGSHVPSIIDPRFLTCGDHLSEVCLMIFVRKTSLVDDPDMMDYEDDTSSVVMDFDHVLATMNATERLEFECAIKEQEFLASRDEFSATLRCPPSFDKISCWPASIPDSLVVIPCFSEFNGVRYDTTKNASRECLSDGTWVSKSNYSMCTVLHMDQTLFNESESVLPHDYSFLIYLVGYSLSLIALFIACGIFFYFKEIHCLRNKIHTNLFVTYILSNMFWILSATIHSTRQDGETNMIWCTSLVFVRFFHLCTFFWMFVEGLYLFVQVIAAFFIDNSCMKLRHYLFIGWGIPFITVGVWATLTSSLNTGMVNQGVNFRGVQYKITTSNFTTMSPSSPSLDCPFMAQNNLEYIYIVPILFVLGLNTFFLVWIMWVVITKLRSSASAAQEHDHQNWKAAKALLVIIPLLGITYLFTISGPSDPTTMAYYIFQHVRAFLLSIQGFAVTLPYCFLNTEIRNVVKNHWDRYQTNRTVVEGIQNVTRGGGQSGRNSFSFYNNDGSRRSSTFRMHFTPTGSNHSGGSGGQNRPRLVHQSSLPASYYVESSFKCPGGASLGGPHGPHPTNSGACANGFKFIRGREHLIDIQKTIEEASDEMKSTSFDQTSTLLPASNSDLQLVKGGEPMAPTTKVINDGVINEEEKSDDLEEENEDERECLLVNKFNGRLEMIHPEPASSKYGTTANGTTNDQTDVTLSVLNSNPMGSLQEKNVN